MRSRGGRRVSNCAEMVLRVNVFCLMNQWHEKNTEEKKKTICSTHLTGSTECFSHSNRSVKVFFLSNSYHLCTKCRMGFGELLTSDSQSEKAHTHSLSSGTRRIEWIFKQNAETISIIRCTF